VKALILAAGQGTRLRPLTDDRPKCLVELAGRSLLELQAAVLREAGILDITVVSGYKAEQIAERGFAVHVNPRYAETNMVATLFSAAEVMDGSEDVLICYGDIVYERRVLDSLLAVNAPVVVMIDRQWLRYWRLRMEDPLNDAETLKIGPEGRLNEIGKKPQNYREIEGQYVGLIKVRSDRLWKLKQTYESMSRIEMYDGKDFDNMYMTSFIQYLIDQEWDVRIAETENGWLEVDSVSDLLLYESMAKDGSLTPFFNLRKINL